MNSIWLYSFILFATTCFIILVVLYFRSRRGKVGGKKKNSRDFIYPLW